MTRIPAKGAINITGKFKLLKTLSMAAVCISIAGCSSNAPAQGTSGTTVVLNGSSSNSVRSNPVANSLEEGIEEPPFSSYTYDFSAYGNNYMLTVTPDDTKTGLVLTLEDNSFGFSTFNVTPPKGYAVYLPYSQSTASTVCTVMHSSDDTENIPDLLKIDFYLSDFEDESKPYSVCRLYTVSNDGLKEFRVFDMRGAENDESSDGEEIPTALDLIPESNIFRSETNKFMSDPKVTVLDNGDLEASIVTYALDFDKMEISCNNEPYDAREDSLYYGYAVSAIAENIYKYFRDTSLNVSDYENYVEIPSADGTSSQYFFKVDDPRFSTVAELRSYAERYFSKDIVDEMFLSAPQQYRDINGELYTIVGDGGYNDTLGRRFITTIESEYPADDDTMIYYTTFHTKQEKFNENHELTGYIDGGDITVQFTDKDPGFIITKYRYPNS